MQQIKGSEFCFDGNGQAELVQ